MDSEPLPVSAAESSINSLLPLETSAQSKTYYLTPNSINLMHCLIYPPGKMGCAADLINMGDFAIDEKLELQR